MFVFQADTYCDSCGEAIRARLNRDIPDYVPADPSDLYSYDSDHYPKPADEDATDYPDHCAAGGECLEGIDLGAYGLDPEDLLVGAETRKVGAILSDGLTSEGMAYTVEMLTRAEPLTPYQRALHHLWRETFDGLTYAETCERARTAGADHGRAAASWYFDGNTSADTYRHVLTGIEDGDPVVMDSLPHSPLSGEWADAPLPRDVLADLDVDEDDDGADDYLDAYCDAFSSAAHDEITRVARLHSFPSDKYAWPGGYPIGYVMEDGEVLCGDCLSNPDNPVSLTDTGGDPSWQWSGSHMIFEGTVADHGAVSCAHCGAVLVSDNPED